MPEDTLNSREYWNQRFEENWQERNGPHYTFSHGETALEHLPEWLFDDLRRHGLSWCDWGCAEGEAVELVRGRFPDNPVTGVDFSSAAVEQAKKKFPEADFRCENWLDAIPAGKFDIVFSSHTLEHFHDPIRILKSVLAAKAEKYLVFLVPFREELHRMEKEHFFRFVPSNLPLAWEDWSCVYYRVINTAGGYWNGTQVLVIYGRNDWLKQNSADFYLSNLPGESGWLKTALRKTEQELVLEKEKSALAEQKRRLQLEHDRLLLEQNKRLEKQLAAAAETGKRAEALGREAAEKLAGELRSRSALEEQLNLLQGAQSRWAEAEAQWSQEREQLHARHSEQEQQIRVQAERLEQLASQAAEREQALEQCRTAIAEATRALDAGKAESDELRAALEKQQAAKQELETRIRETAGQQAEHERLKQELETRIRETAGQQAENDRLKQELKRLDNEVKRHKAALNLFEACRDELTEIKQARSYQLACRFNRLRAKFGLYRGRQAAAPQPQFRQETGRTAAVQPRTQPAAPPAAKAVEGKTLDKLRVAAIMDTFSFASFAPECDLFSFRPDNWKTLFAEQKPDLLLVESAWNGNDGAWQYRVGTYTGVSRAELFELLDGCRAMDIPTVFWNKEDPPHFDKFIEAARKFDYVFTTDENCIPLYQEQCGHRRIHALPFAAQPRLHNPVLSAPRDRDICFAGTYYANRFSDRRAQMDILFNAARELGLDIYDRMYGNTSPGYQNYLFPEELRQFIRGRLEYDDMVKAYRRYKLFLNTNSVADSRTMFSRRVFELLGCGTAVVSTPSDGIRHFFGDIVPEISDAEQGRQVMEKILHDDASRRRLNARGVRLVMDQHTYANRLQTVCRTIGLTLQDASRPAVAMVAGEVRDPEKLLASLERQRLRPELVLLPASQTAAVKKLCAAGWNARAAADAAAELAQRPEITVAAVWHGDDFYAPGYLADAAAALRYSGAAATGMVSVAALRQNSLQWIGSPSDECFLKERLRSATLAFAPGLAGKGRWLEQALREPETDLPVAGFARYGFEYAAGGPAQPEESFLREIVL